jgi:hypothetical protein
MQYLRKSVHEKFTSRHGIILVTISLNNNIERDKEKRRIILELRKATSCLIVCSTISPAETKVANTIVRVK